VTDIRSRPRRSPEAAMLAVAAALGLAAPGARAADVLTQRNNNARTGLNDKETILKRANVTPAQFGKRWTLYADGQVVAQPLYVSKLGIDTTGAPGPLVQGTFDTLLVATMHNTVYAYDANQENRLPDGKTKPLWATWLGQPRPGGKDIDMWSTNDPDWGILATPVVDPQKTTVWVVSWNNENGRFLYRLHSLNLRNGTPRKPSVIIGGAPTNPNQPCKYNGGFNPCTQKQRPGLLLHQGIVYSAFGGDGNRGCLFGHDATTLEQKLFWSVTPTGKDGGIWQSGQGLSADDAGNVYVMTGNGTFDAHQNGQNYGESFVRLAVENGALVVKDYFTPCNQAFLNSIDLDLGSGGAVLIPGSNLLMGAGKEGVLYLLKRNDLGKYQASAQAPACTNGNAVQQFQATELHMHGAGTNFGHVHSSPVFWRGPDAARMYIWGENDHLRAYTLAGGKFTGINQPKKSTFRAPQGMPGGMLSLSSNGTKAGSGIVWAVTPLDGDANTARGVQGIVLALDAQDITKQLWTSELSGARDRLGLFAKFQVPTVADGKVFVPTYGDDEQLRVYGGNTRPTQLPARYYVAVYGLLDHGAHGKTVVNKDEDDVTVVRAVANAPLALDLASCPPADPGNLDCTAALAARFAAPALHRVVVPVNGGVAGCNLLQVTTASKQSAVANSTGIGWYSAEATAGSQAMTTGRFIAKTELKSAGNATLKGGAPAVLHTFVGVANCPAGQSSFDRLFKPYMEFDTPQQTFRNWDRSANYRISRAVPQLDRSAEVLAP
jgi:hypothetical protein